MRKGLDRAIRATAASRSNFELVVVGGNARPGSDSRVSRANAASAIACTSSARRSDSPAFFQASDAFVLPSRAEIWGVTVIEAMACGIPPIVSAAVGSSTAVEDGADGFVFPAEADPTQIAAVFDRVVGDPDLRRSMAHRCRATALRYSVEAHGRLVEQDLEEIVARRAARPGTARG